MAGPKKKAEEYKEQVIGVLLGLLDEPSEPSVYRIRDDTDFSLRKFPGFHKKFKHVAGVYLFVLSKSNNRALVKDCLKKLTKRRTDKEKRVLEKVIPVYVGYSGDIGHRYNKDHTACKEYVKIQERPEKDRLHLYLVIAPLGPAPLAAAMESKLLQTFNFFWNKKNNGNRRLDEIEPFFLKPDEVRRPADDIPGNAGTFRMIGDQLEPIYEEFENRSEDLIVQMSEAFGYPAVA